MRWSGGITIADMNDTKAPKGVSATLRASLPGEGRHLSKFADQALRGMRDAAWLRKFSASVDDSVDFAPSQRSYRHRLTGETAEARVLPWLRVLDLGEPKSSGMAFSIQPIGWIEKQATQDLDVLVQLTRCLVEINLLAVHRSHRGNGYGGLLLEDAEDHYRQAGFSTAMVVVEAGIKPELVGWYERRGYAFGLPEEQPLLRFRTGERNQAFYTDICGKQAIGFKALSGAVTVRRRLCRAGMPDVGEAVRDVLLVEGICD